MNATKPDERISKIVRKFFYNNYIPHLLHIKKN